MASPKTPLPTVDVVLFDGEDRVLLTRRCNPPFKGAYALPGGFFEITVARPRPRGDPGLPGRAGDPFDGLRW